MKAILSILLSTGLATAGMVVPAAAAQAQAPAPPKVPGVSDAGNAILSKAQTSPDPQMAAAIRQIQAAHNQLTAAVMEPTIDVAKVGALMKQQASAETAARTRQNDRLIAVLGQLSPADRGAFLRALISTRPTPAGAPAAR